MKVKDLKIQVLKNQNICMLLTLLKELINFLFEYLPSQRKILLSKELIKKTTNKLNKLFIQKNRETGPLRLYGFNQL